MKRRQFLYATTASAALSLAGKPASAGQSRKRNFIIVLCDDLGFGDIEPEVGAPAVLI